MFKYKVKFKANKGDKMISNTELEIVIEIIATKIAIYSRMSDNIIDDKMKELLKERDRVYLGDEETIKKVFLKYGAEIRGDGKIERNSNIG